MPHRMAGDWRGSTRIWGTRIRLVPLRPWRRPGRSGDAHLGASRGRPSPSCPPRDSLGRWRASSGIGSAFLLYAVAGIHGGPGPLGRLCRAWRPSVENWRQSGANLIDIRRRRHCFLCKDFAHKRPTFSLRRFVLDRSVVVPAVAQAVPPYSERTHGAAAVAALRKHGTDHACLGSDRIHRGRAGGLAGERISVAIWEPPGWAPRFSRTVDRGCRQSGNRQRLRHRLPRKSGR